jgi:tetratricopeptide (TPR) repeat protein
LEKYDEAVQDCDAAISKDPEYAYAYYNRGIAKEMLRDLDAACADWQKAASMGVDIAAEYKRVTCSK